MAGYNWEDGMSENALAAYRAGELPAYKAAKLWGFKSIAALRRHVKPVSWHHTSKFFNATDFFDVEAWLHGKWIDYDSIGDLNEIARDLNRKGKHLILKPLVREMIADHLDCSPPEGNFMLTKIKSAERLAQFLSQKLGRRINAHLDENILSAFRRGELKV